MTSYSARHQLDLDEFTPTLLATPLPGFSRPHRIGAIRVRSADEASELTSCSRSYVIRLIDAVPNPLHPYPPLQTGHAWTREYFFDDILPGSSGVLFSTEVANAILDHLDNVLLAGPIDQLLVHCFAGASRSPAIAGAIAHLCDTQAARVCQRRLSARANHAQPLCV